MAIALWLVPKQSSTLNESLLSLIISLQTLFENAPTFEPHITITSGIRVESRDDIAKVLKSAHAAISSLNQIHQDTPLISFEKLEFGKKYFQKVNLSVAKSAGLVSLAQIIRELFVEIPNLENPEVSVPVKKKRVISQGSIESVGEPKKPVDPKDIPNLAMSAANRWSLEEYSPHLSLAYSSVYTIDAALVRTIRTRVEDLLNVVIDNDNRILDDKASLVWPHDGCLKLVSCEGNVEDWQVLGQVDYHLSD